MLVLVCPAITEGNADWPATNAFATTTGTCVSGYVGSVSRTCTSSGSFSTISGSCSGARGFLFFFLLG